MELRCTGTVEKPWKKLAFCGYMPAVMGSYDSVVIRDCSILDSVVARVRSIVASTGSGRNGQLRSGCQLERYVDGGKHVYRFSWRML